jgi:PAS domain S-box-containing protein
MAARASATDRPRRLVFGFVLLAIVLLAITQGVGLWLERARALDEAERRADNLALILAEHARRTVSAIDASLRHLTLHAERVGGTGAPRAVWEPILQSALAGMSGVGALTLTDAEGTVRHSTAAVVIGQSRRDDYLFQRLAGDPAAGLQTSTPFQGRVTGSMLIPLGRRLARADGGFDGTAVATLVPEQLRDVYRSIDVGQHGAIWLFHPSGVMLLSQPTAAGGIGADVRQHPLFRAPRQDGAATFRGRLATDGPLRIGAVRELSEPPMLLAVSLDQGEVLQSWRRGAALAAGFSAMVAVALAVSGMALLRLLAARARAEQSLARRERELSRAQDIANIGSLTIDLPSLSATASPAAARILGWSSADDETLPFEHLAARIDAADRPRLRAAVETCAGNGEPFGLELRVVRPDGGLRTCWCDGSLVDETAQQRYVLAVLHDITERRQTEDMLRQSQRLESIGHLTGGVAHDFNNLLTVILGQADALAANLTADPALARQAEAILAAGERGAELTRRLLAFARRQPLAPKPVDINELVVGVQEMLRHVLGEQIEIQLVRGAGLWRATVDPAQLENALVNLAVNARDAMPQGGRLTIETGNAQIDEDYAARHGDVAAGRYVLIAVADTGVGMPPEVVARAFEPFFTTKAMGKGTGLGLSMVYGFVKQSGGHIKIYSEPGHGTIIRIYLPQSPEAEAEPLAPPPAAAECPQGRETVLVVEDDELVRAHAIGLLRGLGYRVVAAADGQAALAELRRRADIDLLFTDMVMPGGLSGRELAEAARAIRPGLKLLFTSGYSENAALHHRRLAPGARMLSKPYRQQELARILRQALDSPG